MAETINSDKVAQASSLRRRDSEQRLPRHGSRSADGGGPGITSGSASASPAWSAALIFAATLTAYWPALGAGFIWDDNGHVTRPDLQSPHGLERIWFEPGATQQYYPVLHSAFWVEHRLWGDAALGYHLVNILLHATAACLFGLALSRLWARRPTFFGVPLLAALLFALHPVCVESVAWISEQKNTLSTVFYLLAMLAYLKFTERIFDPSHAKAQSRKEIISTGLGWYVLSFALFILAILSKSVTVTFPAALLVILWWQRGRLSWKRDVLPLLPFFAIGIAGGLFTAWVERRFGGAEGAAYNLNGLERGLLAGRVVWFYLAKLFWPANLIFIYPHWQVSAAVGWQYLFPLGVIGMAAALWLVRKRTRGPLAAFLFFVGTLFPALGFFNVYPFVYSYVADHFQYLASLGIIGLVAAGLEKVEAACCRFWTRQNGASTFGALALLCLLGALTFRQCRTYHDSETLYRTTLIRNPSCWMAHTNLGLELAAAGRLPEAIAHYEQALEIDPSLPTVHNDLGSALVSAGKISEAMAQFREALRLRPRYPEAIYNLGAVLQADGQDQAAIDEFTEAVRLKPNFPEAQYNLGLTLAGLGRLSEGVAHLQEAVRLRPGFPEAHYNLAVALEQMGRREEAAAEFAKAQRLGFQR